MKTLDDLFLILGTVAIVGLIFRSASAGTTILEFFRGIGGTFSAAEGQPFYH